MTEEPKKTSRVKLLIILGGGILVLCICGVIFTSLFPSETTPTPEPIADAVIDTEEPEMQEEILEAPTLTVAPTSTNTPQPTHTATATPDPNFINRGTHLVNVDIEPGIYRGMAGTNIFDSCYWERLSDLSGELNAIIANENALGQFYVEVSDDDFAFRIDCDVARLDPLPEPADEFPVEIDIGMYLVGIDIEPGLYQGLGGDDILDSCYWQRMGDVLGALSSIIANDNSTGQFYIQVSASDFALQTGCPLIRVGD
jgi:hypothetical protein